MDAKMPYYMAYPMPFSYDDERTERMDFEYMKSMYPMRRKGPALCGRGVRPYGYENSMVYDQCPDKLQLRLMCRRVYDNVRSTSVSFSELKRKREAPGHPAAGNRHFRISGLRVSAAAATGIILRLCAILSR